MKPLTGQEIRETWIHFFESKGHHHLPGVNLIPSDDKSLLWVNAGVTGLKKYFDGSEVPPSRRIVNVQKSIRTNDIENVGHTARHHTFFEMLGNFSIGDYFRNEVIPWAYEILTSKTVGFGMDPEKLYVTYNPIDKASFELWQKVGIPASHLVALESNYWQIGEGPCGPNTEVFYDRGESWDPNHLGIKLLQDDIENDRYIEIWGIVFSQYNAVNGVPREKYKELPSKNIDTGAGLERIACILQGTPTNFETDLFMPIIEKCEELSNIKYDEEHKMSFRVIADHIRCLVFALSDGATFSNLGRGYVLRRIIRRAMRYGQKINFHEPFMYKLVHVVVEKYKDFYPELVSKEEEVTNMIRNEEEKFIKTLDKGEAILKEKLQNSKELSGKDVFLLYDTYGFPADLSKEIAAEKGVSCDMEGYEKLMEEQRERARNARGQIDSFHKQSKDLMEFKEESTFLYDAYEVKTKVLAVFVDGIKKDSIEEEGDVIFEKTPFYAEMGGQVSDKGTFKGDNISGLVNNVTSATNGQHLHHVVLQYGTLKAGDEVTLTLDIQRRHLIERNHSATHLLHAALSNVLKKHVKQMGSYVDENYLRFDYETDHKLSNDEIKAIEQEVNDKISEGIQEMTEILPIEEAKKLGAEMEFSEKYGNTVRVVEFSDYSKEFCGGTHVKNTSEIGVFVIESDDAISSGTRRIQALSSLGAYHYLSNRTNALSSAEMILGVKDTALSNRLTSLLDEESSLKKELVEAKEKLAALEAKSISSQIQEINGIAFLPLLKEGASRQELLALGDSLKAGKQDYVFILLGGKDGARPISVFVGGEALKKVKAGDIVKSLAKRLGGSGGGRAEMAFGQLQNANQFLEVANEIVSSLK